MLSPAVRGARGHECRQVLIQPHRQLGQAEHGDTHQVVYRPGLGPGPYARALSA